MAKKSWQKWKYLENEKNFEGEKISAFHHIKKIVSDLKVRLKLCLWTVSHNKLDFFIIFLIVIIISVIIIGILILIFIPFIINVFHVDLENII